MCPCQVSEEGRGSKSQMPQSVGCKLVWRQACLPGVSDDESGRDGEALGVREGAAMTAGSQPPNRWATRLRPFRKSDALLCKPLHWGRG